MKFTDDFVNTCVYNKLGSESGLLPSVVSCRSLQQVSHLTVSLPERYISFAQIILFFFRQGGLQPPSSPAPYADGLGYPRQPYPPYPELSASQVTQERMSSIDCSYYGDYDLV